MSSGIVEPTQNSESEQSPEQQQKKLAAQTGRTAIVQRLLGGAPNLPAFLHDLIMQQAQMVAGTEAAAFVVEPDGQGNATMKVAAHIRPDESAAEVRHAALDAFQSIVKTCLEKGQDGVIQVGDADGQADPQFCLVTLLRAEGNIIAVSAVVTRCRDDERARQRLTPMQIVAGYIEFFVMRRTVDQARGIAQSHQHVLQLVSTVATAEGFEAATMNLCNELSARTRATRASIGWLKGREIKLKAMSHTEEFDKKQELAVQIVKAMEECHDQEEIVQFDPAGTENSQNVTREAAALSRMNGGVMVVSIPLRKGHELVGVLTLEFNQQTKLGPQASTALAVAADVLAPQLYDRFQNDRWLITKMGLSAKHVGEQALGKKHMISKLVILASAGVILFVSLFKPMYRVTAEFQFVSPEKRIISAPYAAQILEVGRNAAGEILKPGDVIHKDDVLAKLFTTDLERQRTEALTQLAAKIAESEKFRADPTKQADYKQARTEAESFKARVATLDEQIKRATIKAPIDGYILSGDLREKRGANVQIGDELMQIGPVDKLQAELTVPERDVQQIRDALDMAAKHNATAGGELATTSLPDVRYAFKVDRIVPMPDPKQGENLFKVYASSTGKVDPRWLPGMKGEARIDVEHRRLAWIWTHRLVDFVRLKLWQ